MKQPTLASSLEKFDDFDLDGGQLALDFINTIDWRNTAKEQEWLGSYTDLLGWGMRVGLLSREDAEALGRQAHRHPAAAESVVLQARDLRERLFRIFNGVIEGRASDPEDWRQFNRAVRTAMGSLAVVRHEGRFVWSLNAIAREPDYVLKHVLKAAADLLIDGDLARLKRCGTPDCQWLFLDTSRNNSRRWCDMRSCGNRAKAKRHYRKNRPATSG